MTIELPATVVMPVLAKLVPECVAGAVNATSSGVVVSTLKYETQTRVESVDVPHENVCPDGETPSTRRNKYPRAEPDPTVTGPVRSVQPDGVVTLAEPATSDTYETSFCTVPVGKTPTTVEPPLATVAARRVGSVFVAVTVPAGAAVSVSATTPVIVASVSGLSAIV
jgi:hypothetical protein